MSADRDAFTAVLASGPLLQSDAIVVLCGEDTAPRIATAFALFKTGGAPLIVLSGGRHEPPRWQGAQALAGKLYTLGVAPARVLIDDDSQNTRQQAVNVIEMAEARGWKRILLVASAYHAPRAFLTFLQVLGEDDRCEREESIQLVNVPATAPWWGSPEGMGPTRLELLAFEQEKIQEYSERGHVASYVDGLASLKRWEGAR
jgi:uncharacterized SAM-binding protein YcdF (DUF218 family)